MKTKQPCESKSKQLRWQSLLDYQSLPQLSFTLKSRRLARAYRELHAGLNALKGALALNRRIYFAVVLMLVAAPLASVAYQLFPKHITVEGWYYLNSYYLLYTLSSHLFLLTTFTGIFFLFPAVSTRRWFMAIPSGYTAGKIIWLAQVTSNEEFHQVAPIGFIALGMLSSVVWLYVFNWLVGRKYHSWDAHIARLRGIIDVPGITDSQRNEMLHREITQLQQFHSKY